jgi:hypothetical protein
LLEVVQAVDTLLVVVEQVVIDHQLLVNHLEAELLLNQL